MIPGQLGDGCRGSAGHDRVPAPRSRTNASPAPSAGALETARESPEHLVVLYETEQALAKRVVRFLLPGLVLEEGLLVVATAEHRSLLRAALTAAGADLASLSRAATYVELDAEDTLGSFLRQGRVDRLGFNSVVGHRVRTMSAAHGRVHIYGEMVACLWGRAGATEAIELERLWNDLATHHNFRLCCAYPTALLRGADAQVDAVLLMHSAAERN